MDRITRRRWSVVGLAVGLPLAAVGLALAARVQPAFYRQAAVAPAVAAARGSGQTSAGRFVSKIAALGSDIARPGPWGAVLSDDEINSWLAIDLFYEHMQLIGRESTSDNAPMAEYRGYANLVGLGLRFHTRLKKSNSSPDTQP